MTVAQILLAATLAVPLLMLAACLSREVRDRMPALLALAPLPALAAALAAPDDTELVLPEMLLDLALVLDTPGAMLLGTAALLWWQRAPLPEPGCEVRRAADVSPCGGC